jgi:hypothetical protein
MKKQLLIIGIIALLVCVGLSGCTNNPLDTERNKFVGTWTCIEGPSKGTSFTFFSDGTGSLLVASITWTLKEGKLVISAEGLTLPYTYSFSNNDRQLTLTAAGSPISEVFIKQ